MDARQVSKGASYSEARNSKKHISQKNEKMSETSDRGEAARRRKSSGFFVCGVKESEWQPSARATGAFGGRGYAGSNLNARQAELFRMGLSRNAGPYKL